MTLEERRMSRSMSGSSSQGGNRPRLHRGLSYVFQQSENAAEGFDDQFLQPQLYHFQMPEARPLLPYVTPREIDDGMDLAMPGPLGFVQSNGFNLFIGAVIVLNMMVFFTELFHKEYKGDTFYILNQGCLTIYVFELLTRAWHFGKRFFNHPRDARWNLFDVVIVCSGVLDQWVAPVIEEELLSSSSVATTANIKSYEATWLPFFRSVRLMRLLRLIKLVRVFLHSDFRWTESSAFNSIVSAVITMNVIIMGLETDIEWPMWDSIENLMLLFFVFEILVRLRRMGYRFFYAGDWVWNVFDFSIVFFGVCDQWLLAIWVAITSSGGSQRADEIGQAMLLMRMLRLLRILRLLRLVKAIKPLYILALGIVEAMQSMFWVLVLTLMALYTSAILLTRMVGYGAMVEDPADIPKKAQSMFDSVFTSMFTLFAIMNGQDWPELGPLLDKFPITKLVFVIFTIFCSWALLSVMTGVVSDNMISVRETQEQKDDVVQGERRQRVLQVLGEIFIAADPACTGILRADEFYSLLNIPFHVRKMQSVAPNTPVKDFRDLFMWLDHSGTGEIDFETFLRGFRTLTEPITGKALLQLDVDAKHMFTKLHREVLELEHGIVSLRHDANERYDSYLEHVKKDLKDKDTKKPVTQDDAMTSFDPSSPTSSKTLKHCGFI